jgi:uncharacterized membrane protein
MSVDRSPDLHDVAERWARSDVARDAARVLDRRVPGALRRGPVAATLRGRGFGHALHPVLTDIPLGMWMAATVLDVAGFGRWRRASLLLTTAGLVAAVPTVATGLAEWEEIPHQDRSTAALHASVNSAATTLFAASAIAKARRRTGLGALLSVTGALTASVGGYLGGHLSFARSVGHGRR